MADEVVIASVREYYEGRLHTFGATAKGVDWKSVESQELRFSQLVPSGFTEGEGSLLDYGCGYGALLTYLRVRGWRGSYTGYDVSPDMVAKARDVHSDDGRFVADVPDIAHDCTLASGLFNVRLGFADDRWEDHISAVLDSMWDITTGVIAFNMLTSFSDVDRQRVDLYYADPSRYLDHCLRRYSRHVRLYHGYGLYEFTIQVEK